ncbi:MAG: energy-coupled thiamine transporter ThiT [Firmicutes bacterium]|nr:energy-coupled thiamine transporter ThiT [Bacillota bacterium]
MKQNYTNTKTFKLVFSALMVAMAVVLSVISEMIPFLTLPFGGSITIFSMVPLIFISQMYGMRWGFASCTVYGLVQMAMGLNNFGYVSGIAAYIVVFLFDYVLAFCAIGLSGITRKMKNKAVAAGLGAFIGCFARFICHFISGCTVWREYSAGWESPAWMPGSLLSPELLPYTYSFTYNCIYMIPETILTVIGSSIICAALFKVFNPEKN